MPSLIGVDKLSHLVLKQSPHIARDGDIEKTSGMALEDSMDSPFLHAWVFSHASATPNASALATPTVRLTYSELAQRVRSFASRLAEGGCRDGSMVLVAIPNVPAAVVASLAIQSLGAVPVEANREWDSQTLADIIARTGARHAIGWGGDGRKWRAILADRSIDALWMVTTGDELPADRHEIDALSARTLPPDGLTNPAPKMPLVFSGSSESIALVLFTSGSTGRPHGVVQTHRNIAANTRSIVEYLELRAPDRALLTLPLYYCYARSVLQTHLFVGGSVYMDDRFRYPRVVLQAMAAEGCTGFAGVPLTFEILRRQVDVASMRFPSLRYVTQAGGHMSIETVAWAREAFRPAQLFVMYGQTEATARLTYLPPTCSTEKSGSIGLAIPGVELRIVDGDGQPVEIGVTGNLIARGDNITRGYLDEPDETKLILRDGWLWTGDLAYQDRDGFFFHQGRSKEMLKIGGRRVGPGEIEAVVARHPDVVEVGVIGEVDSLMGEIPVAYVVRAPGSALDADAVRAFCRDHLPAYKVPEKIVFTSALPRNQAGKLLRGSLASAHRASETGELGAPKPRAPIGPKGS